MSDDHEKMVRDHFKEAVLGKHRICGEVEGVAYTIEEYALIKDLEQLRLMTARWEALDAEHPSLSASEEITEEVVDRLERHAARIRQWYNKQHERDLFYTKDCEHCGHDVASHGHPFKGSSQTSECDKCSCARYVP